MADGATKDYKFGQKNNWRRAMWNEVLRRTAGREKTEPILYLAGSTDLDRDVALSKGVPPQSLIAIDRARQNVRAVRKNRGLAIHGDALDCLLSWPLERPVCAVLLDFCCGLDREVMQGVYTAIERNAALSRAVFCVNFMRGRDASTNDFRQELRQCPLPPLMYKGQPFDPKKHRAVQFILAKAFARASEMFTDQPQCDVSKRIYAAAGGADYISLLIFYLKKVIEKYQPAVWSYRSGVLVFDSAVFTPISYKYSDLETHMQAMGHSKAETRAFVRRYADVDMTRKIGAALAVRTMRCER